MDTTALPMPVFQYLLLVGELNAWRRSFWEDGLDVPDGPEDDRLQALVSLRATLTATEEALLEAELSTAPWSRDTGFYTPLAPKSPVYLRARP